MRKFGFLTGLQDKNRKDEKELKAKVKTKTLTTNPDVPRD